MLAIGFISTDRPDDASELVQTAILGEGEEAGQKSFTASLFEDVLHRDLLLAVQCLGDCNSIDAAFRKQIVTKFTEVYLESQNLQFDKRAELVLKRLKGSDLEVDLVEIALNHLDHENDRKRAKAITILGVLAFSTPQIVDQILGRLADQSENVRIRVIQYFAQFGEPSPEILKRVFAFIDTEQGMVPNLVPLLFWKIKEISPEIELILGEYLRGGQFVIQLNIASWLSDSPEAAVKATWKLIERMRGIDGLEKGEAMLLIGVIGLATREVIQALVEQLEDQRSSVREYAVMALSELSDKSPGVLPILLKYLNDNDEKVRWQVVKGLGKIINLSQETGLKLIEKLNNQSRYVQTFAARSLKQLNIVSPQVAESLLGRFTGDIQEDVIHALELLWVLGVSTPRIEETLLKYVKDERGIVRKEALETLCGLNSKSKVVLDRVIVALGDQCEIVRQKAIQLVGKYQFASPEILGRLENLLASDAEKIEAEVLYTIQKLKVINEGLLKKLTEMIIDESELVGALAAFTLAQCIKSQPIHSDEIKSRILKHTFSAFQRCSRESQIRIESGLVQPGYEVLWESLWQMCEVFEV